MANTESIGLEQEKECQPSSENWFTGCSCEVSNSNCERFKQGGPFEPKLGRMADGVANRGDQLKTIGNEQVSIVAKSTFKFLGEGL